MKQFNFLRMMLAILVMASFAMASCTKEGPAGKDGKDGKDGSDGLPGVDATAVCMTCHTAANMDAKQAQYQFSKHFTGNTSARNGKYCARCHTSEGYLEVTDNGQAVVRNDIANSTRIGCVTCHKHGGFDFENSTDTVSMIMRVTEPVTMVYNDSIVDYGALNNTCATCHQIRGTTTPKVSDTTGTVDPNYVQLAHFPLDNTTDVNTPVQFKVGQSFSVHDGNQFNLFKAQYGYEYPDKTYTKTWVHSDNDCVTCHMNELSADGTTGGHTLLVNEEKCMECHTTDQVASVQLEVDNLLVQLGDELVAKKLFKKTTNSGKVSYSAVNSHDYYGTLFPTTQTTQRFGVSLTNSNTVDPKTGLVVYNSIVKADVDASWELRIGRDWKYGELGAAYNYGFINSELSRGVHNPDYAKELLLYSIQYLQSY